jgi:TRAP-type transport system periplasmic protein
MKRGSRITFMVVTLFAILYLYSSATYAADAVIKLSFASYAPPSHRMSKIHEAFGNEIEKRTNGRVKVVYYAGETLVKAAWTYDAVIKGITDIGHCSVGYTQGQFPLLEVFSVPIGVSSGYQASMLGNAFIDKFKPKELNEVHFLYSTCVSPSIMHTSKKPINTLEDLKGLKIRVQGPAEAIVTALGATPVALPVTETYEAVQKGLVDGVLLPMESLINYRMAEVTTYTTKNYGAATTSIGMYLMNKQKWDSLPPDVQKIFTEVSKQYAEIEARLWNDMDKEGEEFALKKGHKFISVTKDETAKWAERIKPAQDKYLAKMKEKGLPGAEALRFCEDYIQKNPDKN